MHKIVQIRNEIKITNNRGYKGKYRKRQRDSRVIIRKMKTTTEIMKGAKIIRTITKTIEMGTNKNQNKRKHMKS